jgi:integrase
MANRKRLTDANVADLVPVPGDKYEVWDSDLRWMCVRVQGTGRKNFYYVYSRNGRPRWFKIGPAEMKVKAARLRTIALLNDVARGLDPQAERVAQRSHGTTFAELQKRYVEEWAKKHNKSWEQANSLMIACVLPHWGGLKVTEITRAHVKALVGKLSKDRPSLANAVLSAVSAVFTFAVNEEVVAVNPCKGLAKNPTQSRERVLSETEIAIFWEGCELVDPIRAAALRVLLLCAQRPGEVSCMRREHIKDSWWEMPGKPVPELKWPGTKNGSSHRVYLSAKVRELMAQASDDEAGFVFANECGNAVGGLDLAMQRISAAKRLEPPVRPHDLRRSAGSLITGRGHGREAMDRILNHRRKSVTDVYDRHDYAVADKIIMEDLAAAVMAAVEGKQQGDNVVAASFRR